MKDICLWIYRICRICILFCSIGLFIFSSTDPIWVLISGDIAVFFLSTRENFWRRKWQPTPVFLPGESQGWRSLVGCRLWGRTELDTTKTTQQQQQGNFLTILDRLLLVNFPAEMNYPRLSQSLLSVRKQRAEEGALGSKVLPLLINRIWWVGHIFQ